PRQHQNVMVLERTTGRIFSDQLPMLFLEFGSIFSRKNSKRRIPAVLEGRVCQLYASYHGLCSMLCEWPLMSNDASRNDAEGRCWRRTRVSEKPKKVLKLKLKEAPSLRHAIQPGSRLPEPQRTLSFRDEQGSNQRLPI